MYDDYLNDELDYEYWDRENQYIKSSGIYTKEEVEQILANHEEIRRSKKAEVKAKYKGDFEMLRDEREQILFDKEMAEFKKQEYMETKRTTPERIMELQPNEIFVFGSNLAGMHGGGAAYIAYRKFGAIMGQGVGLQGQSYAIPTMQGGVETIRPYVDEFIAFAKEHPTLTFLVTRIGCGIAGFTDEEISPLFEKAHDVENIVLPPNW